MVTRKKAETNTETDAQKIWDTIKNLPIDIYALPDQVVQQHVKREDKMEKVIPDSLHLSLKSAAVLPALEESISRVKLGMAEGIPKILELSQTHKYVVVKIVPKDI